MTVKEFRTSDRLDDAEREGWIARWEWERDTCPQCGQQREVCSDPERLFYPQRDVCWSTVAQAMNEKRYHRLYRSALDSDPDALAGHHIWVSTEDLTPHDDFLAEGVGLAEPTTTDEAVT